MKRFLSFLFIFACLLTIVPPAFAADTITVTAQVPPDWEIANVFFWDADDNGSVWPGTAMTKGADGRYTAEIPAGFTNIIINKQGDQDIQTSNLIINGNADVWVVFDGTNASVHDSDPGLNATPAPGGNTTPAPGGNTGDLSGLNELYIVGTGIPGVGEWNTTDANGKMTANGNIYTITLGMNAGTAIKFKFCGNGSWDSGYNYGGNGEGVIAAAGTPVELSDNGQDISFTASQDCNATFTFDLSTKTLTITEEAGTPIIPEPTPGGNEGGNTGNLSGLEFLCIVGEGLDSLSWDPAAETGKMEGKDGVYTFELDLGEGSTIKFKFCGNGSWDSGYVYGSAANTVDARPDNYYLLNENGGDFTYQASKDCTLTVTVDLANGYVTLREQAVETASHYTIHAKIHTADRPSLYAWGHDCYNMIWPGEKMYKDGDWYTLEISADNEYFNIVGGTNSTDDIEIPSSGTEFWVVCDSDWEYTISSTPPASSLPTVKFHVYAPDATKLSISFEETDDGIFHYVQMERSGKKGWWECTVFTDLGFTVNGDVDCLKEHPLTLPGVTEETWVVLDEEGDHTVSREEPALSKGDNKKKSNKSSDEEVDDQPPVILFVLIGVGVVALAGIAVLVVLIIRKRR